MSHKSFKPFAVDEHERFVQALEKFGDGSTGNEWKDMTNYVGGCRTVQEVKLHGHEYFLRLQAFCAKEASKDFEFDDAKWSAEEDYIFEQALAAYNEGDEHRWNKIAALLPAKTPEDVRRRYQKLLFDMGRIEKGEQIVMNFNTADDTKAKDDDKTVGESKRAMDEEDGAATDEEADPSKGTASITLEMDKESCNAATPVVGQGASSKVMEEAGGMDVGRIIQSDDTAGTPFAAEELSKQPTPMELASENDNKTDVVQMDVVQSLVEPPAAVPCSTTASAPLGEKKEPVGLLLNPRSFSSHEDTANNMKENIYISSAASLPPDHVSGCSLNENTTTKEKDPAPPVSTLKPLEEVQLSLRETPAPATTPLGIMQLPEMSN